MGNCMANNKVMSQEVEDDCRAPFSEDMMGADTALKRPGGGHRRGSAEDRGERKKSKTEKKVRFKLEDDEKGVDNGYIGNRNGVVRRVRVVVTKEELRQILRHAKGSRHSPSCSLEELMVALRSRSEGRVNNGGGHYWRPGLDSIPEDHR